MGFKLGVGGVVTFKNSKLKEVFKEVDISNIVFETDSPYLAMTREERNEPVNVALAVEKLAELHECEVSDIGQQTEKNARYVFDI